MSKYIRPVDFGRFEHIGYEYQHLYVGETCRVIGSSVAAGGAAPTQHTHEVDQLYYVVEGEIHVVLGSEEFVAGPDTLVYIPAGTPHHNWNASDDVNEFHFEVLAPAPFADAPAWQLTDSTDAGDRPYFVKTFGEPDGDGKGWGRTILIDKTDQCDSMFLYRATIPPGAAGPDLHVHRDYDQFYFILEGQLNVQLGLDEFVAEAGSLVVLPAGMPHRQWNASDRPERHLSLITPAPEPGVPGDIPVHFAELARDRN
ncbi:cupin domain-containing protein [Nocardia sp. NPDC059246]|uniref:cupin domain-containing protein n=1 Tax=unclassified Nocardia TaxID=2637762 RepID=UPI00369229A2